MTQELTTQESDALILQEMWLADDNSTTNEEETTETEVEETQEEVEVEEQEEEQSETEEFEDEQEDKASASKPKKWIAKVLHQRNEARKQAEEAITQVQTLQARLEELEAQGNYGNEEYVQTLVDKRIAEKEEISDFFEQNEEIKEFKKDILAYAKETWLDINKASKLYLAENAPEMLLSPQSRAKQQSKALNTPNRTSKDLTQGKLTYSDEEFNTMVKKGLIKF